MKYKLSHFTFIFISLLIVISFTSAMSNTEILSNVEAGIRANTAGIFSFNESIHTNFDLNNDNKVDTTDEILVRNIYDHDDPTFETIFNKLEVAVNKRINVKTDDSNYVAGLDLNGNGEIESSEYWQIIYALIGDRSYTLSDEIIQKGLEKVIRDNNAGITSFDETYANFDLNNDNKVDTTDEILVRNLKTSDTSSQVEEVYNHLSSAIAERIGSTKSDSNYIGEFDTDNSGTIDDSDFTKIKVIIIGTKELKSDSQECLDADTNGDGKIDSSDENSAGKFKFYLYECTGTRETNEEQDQNVTVSSDDTSTNSNDEDYNDKIREEENNSNQQRPEIEVEENQTRIGGKIVTIETRGTSKIIRSGERQAETNLDITTQGAKIYIITPSGNKEIRINVDDALEKSKDYISDINNITIEEFDGRVVYLIRGTKEGRFLLLFKITGNTETQVDAETGALIKTNTPWWAFLTSGI